MSQPTAEPCRLATEPAGTALQVRDVRKEYGPTCALNGVSFEVRPGTVHALLGGNGSGKSTLIKILAGVEAGAGSGSIGACGDSIDDDKTSPEWARDAGVVFVHQDLGLFEGLTVAENLAAGAAFPHRAGVVRWRQIEQHAQELLNEFGIDVRPRDPVASLRPAQKTLVAVARALGSRDRPRAHVLVLDEPTASLPAAETERLLSSLVDFRNQGYAIVYVTHRLDEVLDIGDWVTVLRDGNVVANRPAEGLGKRELIELIAGRQLGSVFPERTPVDVETADVVLDVDRVSGGPLRDVSLKVHAGEIVGVAGLVSSGRSSLLKCVFGLHRHSGVVRVCGRQISNGARAAIRRGVAYVPEDRALDGVFGDLSISVNAAASHDGQYFAAGTHKGRRERAFAASVIERLAVKAPGPDVPIASLSGGNQQKVVLGRWLRPSTKVLLLDEPTQGVDVAARADIYRQIGELRANGLGILLVSSDDEELLGLADRVVVFRRGRVATERHHTSVTRTWLSQAVHGLNHQEAEEEA